MEHWLNGPAKWHFDWPTAIVVLILAPLAVFLSRIALRHLKRWTEYLLDGVLTVCSRWVMKSLARRLALKRYCRLQLAGQSAFLTVPSSSEVRLDIDQVFVPLVLEQANGQNTSDYAQVLRSTNRIRLVGEPGSGKSSLLKWIFRRECRYALGHRDSMLPILIELRSLNSHLAPGLTTVRERGDWLYHEIRSYVAAFDAYRIDECFDTYAVTGGLLILLDGLDEVSARDCEAVIDATCGLSEKLTQLGENNTLVISMRTQFHQLTRGALDAAFPVTLAVKPFTPTGIYEFLERWPFKEKPHDLIEHIYSDLTDRPTLRDMCRNPLVLAMYVGEYVAVGGSLAPETRTEFYRRVVEELVIRRRIRQKGYTSAPTKVREQRERILGRLAYEHLLDVSQNTNSLSWRRGIQVASEILQCGPDDAEQALRVVAIETGLIAEERRNDTFRFIHLTFCEFMAAKEAAEATPDGWNAVMAAHTRFCSQGDPQARSRLLEVIPFACGLLRPMDRLQALEDVTALDDPGVLARCLLETKLYDSDAWVKFVRTERGALLSIPEGRRDEEWLRRLHLFIAVVRDANCCSQLSKIRGGPVDLGAFFARMLMSPGQDTGALLAGYAAHDAVAALGVAEACGIDLIARYPEVAITNCDQLPFASIILRRAERASVEPEVFALVPI